MTPFLLTFHYIRFFNLMSMKKMLVLLLSVGLLSVNAQQIPDTVTLRSFLDGAIQTKMKDKRIPGATLAVIHHGKVVYAKGYGYADADRKIPVNPDSTLFRIGSISKMFTWIAVMQLVSQGKLDLNTDVNQYLTDVKIPEKFGQPITLKHLMTHTPGFEDLVIHLFGKDSLSLKPLNEILKQEMPDRVRPPYTQSSYSNHGTGLAAHVVERVSGLTFQDYVERNIIKPLGMRYTSFRQPLPARLRPLMSKGYREEGGKNVEEIFEYVPLYPVGAASASALDMTRFMKALLHHGKADSVQLLDSATMALMQSPAHRHHPAVNPMRYGFMDVSQNGVTIIGHGGDTFWFHSLMALLPEHDFGIFLSFNSMTAGGAYLDILDLFMDRFFPEQLVAPSFRPSKEFLNKFAGEYRANRYAYHDITTISSLFGRPVIRVADSTAIEVVGSTVKKYIPVDSSTFREVNSNERIAFSFDKKGQVEHMYLSGMPIVALDKVDGMESSSIQYLLWAIVILLTLVGVAYWPLLYRFRRGYQPLLRTRSTLPSDARFVAWINYALLLVFFLGLAVVLSNPFDVVYAIPVALKFLLIIPFLMIVFTIVMLIQLVRVLPSDRYRLWSRLYYLTLCAGSLLSLYLLNHWNFLGYHY